MGGKEIKPERLVTDDIRTSQLPGRHVPQDSALTVRQRTTGVLADMP